MRKSDDSYVPHEPSADIAAALVFGVARPGARVLEIGCGNGDDALFLAQAGCRVKAYDTSKFSVAYARSHRKVLERGGPALKCTFSHGDHRAVMKLAREGKSFDLVSDRLVFSNLAPRLRTRYLQAIAHLIRKGGLFFLRAGIEDPRPTADKQEPWGCITIFRRLFEPVDLLEGAPTRQGRGYKAMAQETPNTAEERVYGRWMPMLPRRGGNSASALVFLLRARSSG